MFDRITQVDIEVENHYKMLEFLKDYKNGIELEFVFLKSIISHFFGTKIKRDFDNLEILIMQSILKKSQYREGVVIDTKPKGMEGALVNAGLKKNVLIDQQINPGVRVTLDMGDYTVVKNESKYIKAKVVSPKTPSENGIYWGYQIRLANSISKVFTESPYPDGYDISIGTSERGKIVDEVINELPEFKHLLIVFGGLSGLEMVIDKDKDLECAGEEADALFDLWINTCPNQGSRTIRTEVL
ncbi:21570_t:CDS:2 [Entrophospora sp. SA101]|nr:21570_t:CDS:2 [Entrophospora sp. SA101]